MDLFHFYLCLTFIVSFATQINSHEGEYAVSNIRTGYTCEGERLHVQCERSQVIQIVRANYGRFSIALCNEDGQTHWSVNCMSLNTSQILKKKCDNLNSCTVPVSSQLFDDSCPGTRKYLEIHYQCVGSGSGTNNPADWYEHNSSEGWLQQGVASNLKLSAQPINVNSGGSRSISGGANSRIPILVATTTSTPRRIPITTPISTTTTTETTTTTTQEPSTIPTTRITSVVAQKISINEPSTAAAVEQENTVINEELWMPPLKDSDVNVPPGLLTDYCPSTKARNLVWKYTKRGSMEVQPCPNGATGLARWSCARRPSGPLELYGGAAQWDTAQPDMSDCKSAAITNLEVKLRQSDPETVIASSLAHLTGSKKLYGGDIDSAAAVMKTVANRIQYLLQQQKDTMYRKEATVQEILLNIVRSGSNLLDPRNLEAWTDLDEGQRMKIAAGVLQGMEDNALIFADVTSQPQVLMESSYNILMSISILDTRFVRNGTLLPIHNYEEPFGQIEDTIFIPGATLRQHYARARNTRPAGLVKIIFFSYKQLETIVADYFPPRFGKVLNSRIVSATLADGRGAALHQPVLVTLVHTRSEGMGRPVCMAWDRDAGDWTDGACRVVTYNRTRTVCECHQLTSYALLMEEDPVTTVVQLPDFHVEIIAASVAVGVLLILIVLAMKWRGHVKKALCNSKEKKTMKLDKSQSFFQGVDHNNQQLHHLQKTGVTGPPGLGSALPDQARVSQYILNNGTLTPVTSYSNSSQYEGFEPMGSNAATLPVNGRNGVFYPLPGTHITLNPYSTSLVDNINRMMLKGGGNGMSASKEDILNGGNGASNHIYQVAMPQQAPTSTAASVISSNGSAVIGGMSPQLSQLTNTLKKKKNCLGGHPGPCHHRGSNGGTTDSSVRSDSAAGGDVETETEMLPPSEVVFRAVSPHGHVYWEIDPKRPLGRFQPDLLVQNHHQQHQLVQSHQQGQQQAQPQQAQQQQQQQQQGSGNSDTDTNNDMHNLSDFSEEDGSKIMSDRSRQSSSRFSDSRPLLPTTSQQHQTMLLQQQFVNSSLTTLPEHNSVNLIQFSPQRFNSLQQKPVLMTASSQDQLGSHVSGFSTRTRLRRPPPNGPPAAHVPEHAPAQEHLQQQVQIPDLRRIPVSVKSSEYIMAKIQSHIDQKQQQTGGRNKSGGGASTPSSTSHSEREV